MTPWIAVLLVAAPELAAHHGRVGASDIVWSTVIEGRWERGDRLELAAPLPPGTAALGELDGLAVALARGPSGEVTALLPLASGGRAELTLVVPSSADALAAPLLAGAVRQRVSLESRDRRFVPDASLGLAPHVGYAATAAVDGRWRDRVDAAVEHVLPEPGPGALYLDGSRPLAGRWESPGTSTAVALVIGALFAALVAALFTAQRGLAKRAAAERADALLEEQLGALGDQR